MNPDDDRAGLHGDDRLKCRASLLPFEPVTLGERLKTQFLRLPPAKARIVSTKYADSRRFDRFQRSEIAKTFELAAAVLNEDEYLYHVLETRTCSALSYELLIDTISRLGPPRTATQNDNPPDRVSRFERDVRRMRRAIEDFCSVVDPCCATAYFYDRRLNRTQFLHQIKLRLPELCHGTVWNHDLPTTVLFDESYTTLYPPFPGSSSLPETPGGFRNREDVDERRVIAVRLAWDQTRVVIFLNWRTDRQTGGSRQEALWAASVSAHSNSPPPTPMAPLQLAVRYLCGWLAVSGIDLSETRFLPSRIAAHEIIKHVYDTSKIADMERRRDALVAAAKSTLITDPPSEYHCNVHWVFDGELVYKRDCYNDETVESEPRYRITTAGDSLPQPKTVCHAACLLGIPLLMNDLDRAVSLLDYKTWRSIHLKRSGFTCESEMAVPIGDCAEICGVVNVECRDRNGLTPLHVARIELVCHLYHALTKAIKSASSPECRRFLTEDLRDAARRFTHAQQLCKRFCEWTCSKLESDLSYFLIYDPRTRVFRPFGITVSPMNALQFLKEPGEAANLGFEIYDRVDETKWMSVWNLYQQHVNKKAPSDTPAEIRLIHSLVEHAVASRVIPSRRRATWQIFRQKGAVGKLIPDIRQTPYRNYFAPATFPYVQTLLGLRFAHTDHARSDGVLWVSWQRKESAERAMNLAVDGPECEWVAEAYRRLQPVMEVVAAMYAVYRHIDPDSAADPLPFSGPTSGYGFAT